MSNHIVIVNYAWHNPNLSYFIPFINRPFLSLIHICIPSLNHSFFVITFIAPLFSPFFPLFSTYTFLSLICIFFLPTSFSLSTPLLPFLPHSLYTPLFPLLHNFKPASLVLSSLHYQPLPFLLLSNQPPFSPIFFHFNFFCHSFILVCLRLYHSCHPLPFLTFLQYSPFPLLFC